MTYPVDKDADIRYQDGLKHLNSAAADFYVRPTFFVNGGAFHFCFATYFLAALQEHFHGGSASFRQVTLDLKLVKLSAGDTAAFSVI